LSDIRNSGPAASLFAALGIGPEAELLHEPRLLLNSQFLGALLAEIEDELGCDGARLTFFQLGFVHGLRDAQRIMNTSFQASDFGAGPNAEAPPLAIQLGGHRRDGESGGITLSGSWPERFEANARVARLGPDDAPSCALSAGYTSGWLSGTLETDILVREETCSARGDAACTFRAAEPMVWQRTDDPHVKSLLRQIPVPALRELVAQCHVATLSDPAGGFDPDDPAVHTWGPVMVLPFIGPDDALATIELLGRNPDTCSARVVVIDLRGSDLDEGFGAAALEQVLGQIESWGADSILTGVSQFSEPVVEGLEVAHCILRKDLSEAIASAFQLADAQRHLL
jgi:hypothetical protein